MAADPTKWKTGKTLGTRIPVDLYERLEHIGEQLIAAGLDEDDRRSKRGKRPTPLAVAVRRGLHLAADAMEAQLAAAAPDSDTPPERRGPDRPGIGIWVRESPTHRAHLVERDSGGVLHFQCGRAESAESVGPAPADADRCAKCSG